MSDAAIENTATPLSVIVKEPPVQTKPNYTSADFRALRVPVWIADGDREAYIKRSDTDMMARAIPGASELIFPDADHYAMWEDPALFSRAVLSFLGRMVVLAVVHALHYSTPCQR